MGKAKSPKLHLSLLTSLQICRPRNPCSMIKSPLPPYMLSPSNSKSFDIFLRGTPVPPPSTPSAPLEHNMIRRSRETTYSFFSSPPPPPLKKVRGKREAKHEPRRFKRYGSKEWENEEMDQMLAPCMEMEMEMEQSFVVVKKSVDPYEDFKKSMSEMIVAKNIFEPRELEQLLMSFLSLNSRLHHKVIIEAFTEILKMII